MTSSRILPALAAAGVLLAGSALASPDGNHDDTTYPGAPSVFANAIDSAPVVTPDVRYPGPHAAVVKGNPGPALTAAGRYDDTSYGAGEARSTRSGAAAPRVARAEEGRPAPCGCHG